MARIITIETSGGVASVALAIDGQCAAVHSVAGNEQTHSLTLFIEDILTAHCLTIDDLDAVAVSSGPGSYTGLRIGVSVAKGICFAAHKALIAVPTLDALTVGAIASGAVQDPSTILVPMIDARRMEIYTATYNAKGELLSRVEAMVVDEGSFAALRSKKVLAYGSGAAKCVPLLGFDMIDVPLSAEWLVALAQEKFDQNQTQDVAYFEPAYLKEFVALTSKKKMF
ncbi:MAG: tRNA (adenosine(37)-N6)-threonylcarbamoyltransferase complex dimerization subunit type 1 TsaB [Mucinivorans sp.]